MNVPIPQNPDQYKAQEPKPQEAGQHMANDLEYELQNGSDVMRR